MHTGVISFCDRIYLNVKCSIFKDEMLRRLNATFGIKVIARHWHRLEEKAIALVCNPRTPHWMCIRSNGNPYWLVLTVYEDVPMMVFIDKKVQPGYEYPRMILGRGQFPPSAYDGSGTILDGEMVKDKRGGWVYLINDALGCAGRVFATNQNISLQARLASVSNNVLDGYVHDPHMSGCVFHIKRYFAPSAEGFTHMLEMAQELPYTQRGVYFWPDRATYKPKLHNFDDSLIKAVVRTVKDVPEFREAVTREAVTREAVITREAVCREAPVMDAPAPKTQYKEKPSDNSTTTLWLKKTENPDIYDVYLPSNNDKLGVAGVPSLTTSKMLRAVFKTRTIAQPAAFECTWHDEFQKYVPQRAC